MVELKAVNHACLTDSELKFFLKSPTRDSRYSRVKRLLAQGKLIHLRRGLYCLTEKLGYTTKPHPFELAQHIYSPSYISLESALSFHGLIPETVYTTTSVTTKRAKEFNTPLGIFNYLHLPQANFYLLIELIQENGYSFFMAKPWKAICDYIYCYKKNWTSLSSMAENLRLNLDNLPFLRLEEIELLNEYYHHSRVSRFLNAIKKERETL